MYFKENEVIFLIGAGASAEAGIPTSKTMINSIERLVDSDWGKFKELYDYIKSAIFYADGILGKFDNRVSYNIERLINVLYELEQKEQHTIYPFIGNWNIKLIELAGNDFSLIKDFRRHIINELQTNWIAQDDYSRGYYYEGLVKVKNQLTHQIRVFTLNYDLCIEKNCGELQIEMGFDPDTRIWDWRRFESNPNVDIDMYLYKLHGSIDWKRDSKGNLTYSDDFSKIKQEELQIIFGTNYKLQYTDPFLFSVYEFRKFSLDAKLIVVVGYSFSDPHINGIISQALKNNSSSKLLAVSLADNDTRLKDNILANLGGVLSSQIIAKTSGAKHFLGEVIDVDELSVLFSTKIDEPF